MHFATLHTAHCTYTITKDTSVVNGAVIGLGQILMILNSHERPIIQSVHPPSPRILPDLTFPKMNRRGRGLYTLEYTVEYLY